MCLTWYMLMSASLLDGLVFVVAETGNLIKADIVLFNKIRRQLADLWIFICRPLKCHSVYCRSANN